MNSVDHKKNQIGRIKQFSGVILLRAVAQIEFYLLTPPHLVRQIFGFFLKYFYKRTNSN